MKVLFIVSDNFQEDNRFPLGIAYLSSMATAFGCDVTIYNQDVCHYDNEHLATFLDSHEFDIIGLGFLAGKFTKVVLPLCNIINKNKKNAWFIIGGHAPSATPEYILKKTGADIVVIGEGETTLIEILRCKLVAGKGLDKITNILYKDDKYTVGHYQHESPLNINNILLPQWNLFPIDKYSTNIQFFNHEPNDKYLSIITSRGCINNCSFCYRLETGYRTRHVDNVIKEIQILNTEYGINYFEIQDEMFILSAERLKEFRDKLKQYNLKIKYTCDGRVDYCNEEILELLKDSGCTFLNFGFESTNQTVLNLMNKNVSVEDNYKTALLTKKFGLNMGINILWGLPGDTIESLRNNVLFIKTFNTYCQLRTIRPPTPFPNSPLYCEAIEKKLLKGPEDFYDKFKNSDLITVNFTEIPEKDFYKYLFEANRMLILDHYEHTTKDNLEAANLIEKFYNLYFLGDTNFSGPRHYDRREHE